MRPSSRQSTTISSSISFRNLYTTPISVTITSPSWLYSVFDGAQEEFKGGQHLEGDRSINPCAAPEEDGTESTHCHLSTVIYLLPAQNLSVGRQPSKYTQMYTARQTPVLARADGPCTIAEEQSRPPQKRKPPLPSCVLYCTVAALLLYAVPTIARWSSTYAVLIYSGLVGRQGRSAGAHKQSCPIAQTEPNHGVAWRVCSGWISFT